MNRLRVQHLSVDLELQKQANRQLTQRDKCAFYAQSNIGYERRTKPLGERGRQGWERRRQKRRKKRRRRRGGVVGERWLGYTLQGRTDIKKRQCYREEGLLSKTLCYRQEGLVLKTLCYRQKGLMFKKHLYRDEGLMLKTL